MTYITTIYLPPKYTTLTKTTYITITTTTMITLTTTVTATTETTTTTEPLTKTTTSTEAVNTTTTQTAETVSTATQGEVTKQSEEINKDLQIIVDELTKIQQQQVNLFSDVVTLLSDLEVLKSKYLALGIRDAVVEDLISRSESFLKSKASDLAVSRLSHLESLIKSATSSEVVDQIISELTMIKSLAQKLGLNNIVQMSESLLNLAGERKKSIEITQKEKEILNELNQLMSRQLNTYQDITEYVKSLSNIKQKYSELLTLMGTPSPDIENKLQSISNQLMNGLTNFIDMKLNEIMSKAQSNAQEAKRMANELVSWYQSIKSFNIPLPQNVESKILGIDALIKASQEVKTALQSSDEKIRSNIIEKMSTALSRMMALAPVLSRETWQTLLKSAGMSESDINLIRKYVSGDNLTDAELDRLSLLYINLDFALNNILSNELIEKALSTRIIPSAEILQLPGADKYVRYDPMMDAYVMTLSDYEKIIKENISKGYVPSLPFGVQLNWMLNEALRTADVLSLSSEKITEFLKSMGIPSPVASAIGSAIPSAIVSLGLITPAAPISAALLSVNIANTLKQLTEYLNDDIERNMFWEYVKERNQDIVASILGSIIGGVAGVKLTPLIAAKLGNTLKSMGGKYASIGEKLIEFSNLSDKYGEFKSTSSEYGMFMNKATGEILIVKYSEGKIQPVGKFVGEPHLISITESNSVGVSRLVDLLTKVYKKEDVTDVINSLITKVNNKVKSLGLGPESTAKLIDYINDLIESAGSKGMTVRVEDLIFLNKGTDVVPVFNPADEITVALNINGKPLEVNKGAIASVEVVDLLRRLGMKIDDIIELGKKISSSPEGVGTYVIDKDKILKMTPNEITVIKGSDVYKFPNLWQYFKEAESLLNSFPEYVDVFKDMGKVVTAPYTITPPPVPAPGIEAPYNWFIRNASNVLGTDRSTIMIGGRNTSALASFTRQLINFDDMTASIAAIDLINGRTDFLNNMIRQSPKGERLTAWYMKLSGEQANKLFEYIDTLKKEGRLPSINSVDDVVNLIKSSAAKYNDKALAEVATKLEIALKSSESSPLMLISTPNDIYVVAAVPIEATDILNKEVLSEEDIKKLGVDLNKITTLTPEYSPISSLRDEVIPYPIAEEITTAATEKKFEPPKPDLIKLQPEYRPISSLRDEVIPYPIAEEITTAATEKKFEPPKPDLIKLQPEYSPISSLRDEVIPYPIAEEIISNIAEKVGKPTTEVINLKQEQLPSSEVNEVVIPYPLYDEVAVPQSKTVPAVGLQTIQVEVVVEYVPILNEVFLPYTEPITIPALPGLEGFGEVSPTTMPMMPSGTSTAVGREKGVKELEKVIF